MIRRVGRAIVCGVTPLMLIGLVHGQTRRSLTFVGVSVIDTRSGAVQENRSVTVDAGTITSIAVGGTIPPNTEPVDARGKYLIPGLWDMHAHHQLSGEESLPVYVATGVTGTRDMGADLELILGLRESVAAGRLLGPRIVAAGPILDNVPGLPLRMSIQTAEQGRTAVRTLKQRGVDFIKVHDRTPREAYLAIADEAKRLQLPLAGHVPRGVTFDEAGQAGQRSIEHLAGFRVYTQCSGGDTYSADRCRPLFESMARSGMWQTPTLVSWRNMFSIGTPLGSAEEDHWAFASPSLRGFLTLNQQMSKVTPEGVRGLRAAADVAAVVVSDMQKLGIGILAGCDGMVPGFCVQDELVLLVRGGMSPLGALQTATINPARYLQRDRIFGSVEVGRAADLVLLDANPLENIENVRRINAVMVAGRLLDRQELDAILAKSRREFEAAPPRPPK
jgi:imidazolonepropionase-like amidohydrolase